MEQIIKVNKSPTTGNPFVDARELYRFLEITKEFSTWIKEKLKKWDFIENQDYARIFYDVHGNVLKISLNKKGHMEECEFANLIYRIEYPLTLDTAKELSMVQNNNKGREARRYFIAVEKEWKKLKEKELSKATQIQFKNLGFKEAAKFYNTSSIRVNHALKAGRYLRPNNKPYVKYLLQGYFAWQLYDERFTRKHVTLTPGKGMPLLGKLLGKNNMQAIIKHNVTKINSEVAVINSKVAVINSKVPANIASSDITGVQMVQIPQNLLNIILIDHNTLFSMTNYMIMAKSGIHNPIEEEKYMTALKTFHIDYLKNNPE